MNAVAASSAPTCPRCGALRCSRVKRHGFFQRYILPYFERYPWECGGCRLVFLAGSRGATKRRRHSAGNLGE